MNTAQKPKIMVTGAGGALARRAISFLKNDYQIIAVDFRKAAEFDASIPSYRVDFNKRSFEDVFRSHEIEGVLHLGRVGPDVSDRHNRYNANVLGTRKLLDLSRKYGVGRVVVLSTYFVYGANPYNPALMDESTPKKASELTSDLIDAVELENLAILYLWKYPELNITILRPCNIAGPGIRNSMGLLLSSRVAPVLIGFSPMMQYIHVDDAARAVELAYRKNRPGIYNVAPGDWIAYQEALDHCGCIRFPVFSYPDFIPHRIGRALNWKFFPPYFINFLKYPVVIDGKLFEKNFDFRIEYDMADIFAHYREKKQLKKQIERFLPEKEAES